ncbi:MAG: hypothetical protein JNK09_06495 [Prolixibacteraceae bacterium]|nr:hypothetical protein [Prolixibacteraceae bacterium]
MVIIRKKILKLVTAFLSGILLIVLAAFVLIYFEAQNYLNKNLSEFVAKKSKGKYELSFNNLEINFSNWGFEIHEVAFHPSDSILKTISVSNPEKQFYSFASPKISFSGLQLRKLIFQKNLEIDEISISQPELNIHGKTKESDDKKNNIAELFQELKPLVTKTFKSINIGKIELANASFDFYNLLGDSRKLSKAENITIGVLGFHTDSLLLPNPDRLFEAKDIYLQMFNYQNKLADSIHTLSAGTITYSLKHARIEAQNIELVPDGKIITDKGKYQVFVSQARVNSNQISNFYKSNSIPIDSLALTGAKIKYWPGSKKGKTKFTSIAEFNLYDLIKAEFSSVHISNFGLRDVQLMLYKNQMAQINHQELKNISIDLHDFLLDSVSIKDTSRIFYSKNIDFSASEYEFTLGDNIHRIRAGQLELSTKNKSVLVKNIQLYPIQNTTTASSQKNTIDASCDSVRLDQFNFKKAFHDERFVFQRINLFNPEVSLTQNTVAVRDTMENSSFIYKLISSYVKGIYSAQVVVEKGKVHLINKTGVLQTGNIESNLRLKLFGFALDEATAKRTDRLFFANQIDLNFNNYQMQLVDQLHRLSIDDLSISTRKKQAHLSNLHLTPVSKENMLDLLKQYNRSESYEFTIPELTLANADFHEAFYNKKLTVDTLLIRSPEIYYENFAMLKQLRPKAEFEDLYQLLSNYLDDIHLKNVDIPDGIIRLVNHSRKGKTISLDNHFTLGLENTIVNKEQFGRKKLLFSEYIDFSVRDHLIRLSDNVHVMKAREIGFSTKRKEIYATNARLYPETASKDFTSTKWNIQLAIPEIRIRGINIEDLYFDRAIKADNLLINSPEIKLYQKQKKTGDKELKEMSVPLPKEIESIAVQQFNLNNGSLKVFSELETKPYLLVQSDLKMMAQNILIQSNPTTEKPEFKSGNYTSQLVQFSFFPKGKNQEFSVDELTFSTLDKRIQTKNMKLKPKSLSSKIDQFKLSIPLLTLSGFDIDKAYRNDEFFFDAIQVEKPSLEVFNNTKDSVKINPFSLNLYPHFDSFANVFVSKMLDIREAEISITKNGQKKWQEKISFNLANVRIDNKRSDGFMHSEEFSFRVPNVKRQDKFYQYTFGVLSYSSVKNQFLVKDIRITPNFSKEKFQKQISFQTDYFSGKIDSVSIFQPNIRQWFDKDEIIGKSLLMNGLKLDIYRDKRVTFNENRRPGMLQDLIKSIKVPLSLDSINLINAEVTYSEQPATGDQEGKIRFTDIQATLKPFTNMKSSGGKIPDFSLNGAATIMDSCRLETNMKYQMNHPDNLFTASGNLSPFNMRILNPVLEPLASVSLRSGHVDRFQFTFSADKNKASGHLIFGYNDMKIAVLEKKNGNTKEAKFASFLANSLLLRSKNPRGKELLPDEINFVRDQRRSVLNYWWKSVFSGVRNTLGIKEEKQEEEDKK